MLVELPAVFKADLESATPRTRQVMASVTRKYLRWCRDLQQDYRSIATAQGYLTSLEESGAKPGYRKYCHGAIHKMFKAEGLSTELLRAPKVAAEDWSRPAIPPDVVKSMINASNKKLTRLEQAYLALATVYGFRADELGRIGPDCFDWERGVLQIQAAKKGMMRVHLVPEYLQGLLKEIKAPIGSGKVYETWYLVEHKLMGKHATRTGFHCLPPGTLVSSQDGQRPIEQIKVGDLVFGSKGLTRVTHTFQYDYAGEMYKLSPYGILPFQVTPNHPVLIAQVGREYDRRRNHKGFAYPKVIKSISWKMPADLSIQSLPQTNLGSSLATTDYLVVPKLKAGLQAPVFDLEPYTLPYGRQWNRWPRYISMQNGGSYLMGLYLADGSSSVGQTEIVCEAYEVNKISRLQKTIHEWGYKSRLVEGPPMGTEFTINGRTFTNHSPLLKVVFGGHSLHRFWADQAGHTARGKHVPAAFFTSPSESIRALIEGYFGGDGSLKKHACAGSRTYEASSVSPRLLLEMQQLLTGLGIFSNLCVHPSDPERPRLTIPAYDSNLIRQVPQDVHIRRGRPILQDEDYFYVPLKKVERLDYSGMVHNIETESRDYAVHNVIVHNSIRRSLDALLTDQLSDSVVRRFFGWRNKESDMTQRYGYVSYVDYTSTKGETRTSYSRAKEVDEQVFRIHPFLQIWKQALEEGQ